jgi:hypothetical protein
MLYILLPTFLRFVHNKVTLHFLVQKKILCEAVSFNVTERGLKVQLLLS